MLRRLCLAVGLALWLPAGCGGGTAQHPTAAPQARATAPNPSACRSGNPLANVYHPYRLHVVDSCKTVTGRVAYVRHEDDGDMHINLRLDPKYANLLDARNRSAEHGDLVVEIVPADQPGCTAGKPPRPPHGTYDFGRCTGADIADPPVGAHIRVTGPYVRDNDHGWMEIHPVWSWQSIP